ncbi:hypothetical protein RO3G_15146 [Rhizopus delemar RA 99-880]|uniref:Transposase Tc1-like domain-containing protein n=1 Tax=Rhizopus delemar (strain RA 99-880 / ATCC MYA-4621 / FGSC 9543 / NRRL 43880) TaxID=246409 RepID=I1CPQ5_RHIO9|nr:hypothetical protein RO3G_15146 [Rhizopus delemar RA 99-880]|eukprot:EIE90435.1 hypothetical protein RO3G_15146 [Rhizopus delemar RA 99-880]
MTGLSKSTVGKLRKSHCSSVMKPNGGRSKALSAANERYYVRKVTKDRVLSTVTVTECLENALRKAGLGVIEKPKKPLLSAKNIRNRLSWCIAHSDFTVGDWRGVIWSDETKINRFNSDRCTWAWIRSGESLKSHHVKIAVKHGGCNNMLWSAITYAGVGWICKINEYGVDKLGFERHQVICQHDNDTKHTSTVVKEYLQKHSYDVLRCPAQPPDLKPNKNM